MNQEIKTSAKDFFLNLGVIVALYTSSIALLTLVFTVINRAYPKISGNFNGSESISLPVSILLIFFPIFVFLVWFLEKSYRTEPEKKHLTVKKWLNYLTLFVSGVAMAVDLVMVIFYFIDGQELTTGFVMKILAVFVVTLAIFVYFISDIKEKLNSKSRKIWGAVAVIVVLGSVIWGFSVLGSPRTQRLYKYDNQKVNDLSNINNEISNYYSTKGVLPENLTQLSTGYAFPVLQDMQTQKPYEYEKTGNLTYKLCAEFNFESTKEKNGSISYPMYGRDGFVYWNHQAGRHCFEQTINPNSYTKSIIVK